MTIADDPKLNGLLREWRDAEPGIASRQAYARLIAYIDARQPRPSSSEELPTAEDYLRQRYGAYRGHHEWRALEEAFNAGRAARLARSAGAAQGEFRLVPVNPPLSMAKAFRDADLNGDRFLDGYAAMLAAAPTAQAGAAEGEHAEALRLEEIKGYERGVRDAQLIAERAAQQADAPAVAESITIPRHELLEADDYGVDGSTFWRCKLCGQESGAGLLAKGVPHLESCPLHSENAHLYSAHPTLPLPSGQAEAARVALETICATCGHDFGRHRRKDSLCPIREDGRYLGWADTVFAAPLPPATTPAARDWPEDFAQENGEYQNWCSACEHLFFGHKRRVICKACASKASSSDEAKDAALEDAAKLLDKKYARQFAGPWAAEIRAMKSSAAITKGEAKAQEKGGAK